MPDLVTSTDGVPVFASTLAVAVIVGVTPSVPAGPCNPLIP